MDSLSQKSLSHSSGMVYVASPFVSGRLFPGQLRSALEAGSSRGGLRIADLGPEGTSGIPLCSYRGVSAKRHNRELDGWLDSPAPSVAQ